jgi:hypothetical protein
MAVNADHAALFVKAVEPFVISLFVWHATSSFSPFSYPLEEGEKVEWEKGKNEQKCPLPFHHFPISPFRPIPPGCPLFADSLKY